MIYISYMLKATQENTLYLPIKTKQNNFQVVNLKIAFFNEGKMNQKKF